MQDLLSIMKHYSGTSPDFRSRVEAQYDLIQRKSPVMAGIVDDVGFSIFSAKHMADIPAMTPFLAADPDLAMAQGYCAVNLKDRQFKPFIAVAEFYGDDPVENVEAIATHEFCHGVDCGFETRLSDAPSIRRSYDG